MSKKHMAALGGHKSSNSVVIEGVSLRGKWREHGADNVLHLQAKINPLAPEISVKF
jgi:hypothetical protein